MIKDAIARDPFLLYGPGLRNFLKLSSRLTCLFVAISIFAFFQILLFTSASDTNFQDYSYFFTPYFSAGNLGFPTTQCSKAQLNWGKEQIQPNIVI